MKFNRIKYTKTQQKGASDAGIVVIAYIHFNNVFFVKVNAIYFQFALECRG